MIVLGNVSTFASGCSMWQKYKIHVGIKDCRNSRRQGHMVSQKYVGLRMAKIRIWFDMKGNQKQFLRKVLSDLWNTLQVEKR